MKSIDYKRQEKALREKTRLSEFDIDNFNILWKEYVEDGAPMTQGAVNLRLALIDYKIKQGYEQGKKESLLLRSSAEKPLGKTEIYPKVFGLKVKSDEEIRAHLNHLIEANARIYSGSQKTYLKGQIFALKWAFGEADLPKFVKMDIQKQERLATLEKVRKKLSLLPFQQTWLEKEIKEAKK